MSTRSAQAPKAVPRSNFWAAIQIWYPCPTHQNDCLSQKKSVGNWLCPGVGCSFRFNECLRESGKLQPTPKFEKNQNLALMAFCRCDLQFWKLPWLYISKEVLGNETGPKSAHSFDQKLFFYSVLPSSKKWQFMAACSQGTNLQLLQFSQATAALDI